MDKKKEPKPDPNQTEFKVYFILSTDVNKKIDTTKFFMDKKGFGDFVCEKVFPVVNNKYGARIFSSTYDKNSMKDKEIIINYTKNNISEKYTLNVNDNYLFNVKLKNTGLMGFFNPFPEQQQLLEKTQYKYYSDFLKENKLQTTYTKRNLNRDIVRVMNNSKTIEFSLFLNIFKEVFNVDFVKQLLVLFKEDKIYIKEKIDPSAHQAVIKLVYKNTNKVLGLILGSKKKQFGEKLYLVIIYYYYYVLPENFLNIFEERKKKYKDEKDEFEIDIVDLFFQNEKMFKAKDDSNIINMFKYVDSYEKLMILLKKISSFSNWIKTIENNKEQIIKLLMPKNVYLKLDDCSGQPEEKKLDEILDNINKIKVFSKNNQYEILKLPFNFYQNLLSNCGNNLDNLNKLKNIFKKMTNLPQKITEEIEEKEHNIYDRKIRNEKLINVEMLENLIKDPYYQKPQGNYKIDKFKKANFILDHISFEQLKMKGKEEIDKFIDLFQKLNFKTIFTPQLYKELNEGLLEKIKKFEEFYFVYAFTDFSSKDWRLLNKVHDKFIKLLKDCKGQNPNIESYTLKYVTSNLEIGYKDEVSKVLVEINKVVNPKICRNIMVKIIELISNEDNNKNNKKLNIPSPDKLKGEIFKFFENDLNGANLETINFFFGNIKDINSLRILFKKFNPLIIKEDEFFLEKESENFKIFNHVKDFQLLNNEYLQDIEYIKRTKSICNKIIQDLNNFNVTHDCCATIYKLKNQFKERIIKISNQKNGEGIYNKIIIQIEKLLRAKDNIKQIIMFLIAFYPTSNDKSTILNLNKDLNKLKLSEYQTKEKEINKYLNLYLNLSNKFYKFNNSSFFKAIFKEIQEDNIENKLNNAEESFKTLKNLLDEKYLEIDKNILKIIFKTIKNIKSLQKDIDFLKKYFNIQKDTEKIETTIMILSSQDKIKAILYLFDELNIQKGEFSNKLNEILSSSPTNSIKFLIPSTSLSLINGIKSFLFVN